MVTPVRVMAAVSGMLRTGTEWEVTAAASPPTGASPRLPWVLGCVTVQLQSMAGSRPPDLVSPPPWAAVVQSICWLPPPAPPLPGAELCCPCTCCTWVCCSMTVSSTCWNSAFHLVSWAASVAAWSPPWAWYGGGACSG